MPTKRMFFTVALVASAAMLVVGISPWISGSARALPPAQAPVPPGVTIPYPGRLADAAGQPVVDGAYDLAFALYAAETGGEPVWSEVQEGVMVQGGAFSASLGGMTSLPTEALTGGERWLAVGVRGPGEADFTALTPRQQLSAALPAPDSASTGLACPHDHWGETWSGSGTGLSLNVTGVGGTGIFAQTSSGGTGVYGSSPSGNGVYGNSTTGYGVYGSSTGGTGVHGETTDTTGNTAGVWGQIASSGTYARAVVGYATNTTGVNYGVWGQSESSLGYGVKGISPYMGVWGESTSATGTGVYGKNSSGGWAGYFNGNVHVNGTLTKSAGGFQIDHPLDPANQYLTHSFVESPDMKNVYDGVATLDANGEAVVTLPAWFDVLNRDFRYQLTCIGGYAPVYIVEEIQDNQFKIAGGQPGLKVSWQVTGIRQDPWANEHRILVEEDKSPDDRGNYLYPQGYGQPGTMQIGPKGPQNE
ncbi:MAG: hypothetical protein KKA73_18495 [Chloroflexi bacterium]|nr:hypothetical protein [Chloroflexota bacterium]MBU1749678.1 hypothetical protein [Chloroflexota bacterium]